MIRYLILAMGGAVGTMARYAVSSSTYRIFQAGIFPWGTLTVNITGSLLIGILAGFNENNLISPNMRTFLFIGILGGYTTFSTFSLETMNMVRTGEIRYAVINLIASNVFGVALAFGGYFLVRYYINTVK